MRRVALSLAAAVALPACSFDSPPTSRTLGGSRSVRGQVVDYRTGAPVTGAQLAIAGLTADVAPDTSVDGAAFAVESIVENSLIQVRVTAAGYRSTFASAVFVADRDIADLQLPVVSDAYAAELVSGFAVSPATTSGTLIGRLVRDGMPTAGVKAVNFSQMPYFLDANRAPATAATASSASGGVVFFGLPPVPIELGQPEAPEIGIDMALAPVEAGAVTLADITVLDAPITLPVDVSFATQVAPLFGKLGCVACHSGGGEGKNLGGLTLDGSTQKVYSEVVAGRVYPPPQTDPKLTPEASRLLTMPSATPTDNHPNITFRSSRDYDYLTILVWIREGAKDN